MSNFDNFFPFNRAFEKAWTPVLEDETGNIATLSDANGTSLRFGSYVWVSFGIVTSSIAGLIGGETLLIKGLPYMPVTSNAIALTSLDNLNLASGDSVPRGYTDENSFPGAIAMQFFPLNAQGDVVFPVSKWTDTATVIGSGFYQTTD